LFLVSGRKKIKIIKPKIEWRRLRLIPAFWRALFCFFLLAFYFYCRPPEIKESFLFFPFPAVISLKMKYGKNNAGRSREAAKDERRSGGGGRQPRFISLFYCGGLFLLPGIFLSVFLLLFAFARLYFRRPLIFFPLIKESANRK